MKKIVVIGSLNMDSVIETVHMPKVGETISGLGITLVPGGKGANQAFAIGRLGGQVSMIGAVGDDVHGKILKDNLDSTGVDTRSLNIISGETTGQAFITVDREGDNSIIIISGANGLVTKELIDTYISVIENSDIVIMQFEIPIETVTYVKDLAVKKGKIVIVDPAPAVSGLQDGFWKDIDYIKPNETELEILVGRKLNTQHEVEQAAKEMINKGVKHVIVTLGADGCLLISDESTQLFPANKVKAIDTTAAGDSFTAAFALALSEGKTQEEAILFGQKVSSIVVTRKGAQTSIPTRDEVQ